MDNSKITSNQTSGGQWGNGHLMITQEQTKIRRTNKSFIINHHHLKSKSTKLARKINYHFSPEWNRTLIIIVILYKILITWPTDLYTTTTTTTTHSGLSSNNILFGPHILMVGAIAPTIDYSHNMRILKLPKSTPIGSLIYRLRGSDGDPNSQLMFGVSGIEGRALLDIIPVSRSWNEADVYLRSPLEEPLYNLTIYVTDGNKTTQVESTILVTNDNDLNFNSNNINNISDFLTADNFPINNQYQQQLQLLPFVNPRHVFHVPENTQPDEPIGFVTALESQKSDLPVRFELRGKGSDKFSIKYVFGPKGQSKADIVLAQALDYEQQNLFTLKVLALNAWTNSKVDTRNVATMDIVITVGDVQDTAPVFKRLPQSLHLFNTMKPGDLLIKLEAEDGDYADQRPINFALDASSPLASYFSLDKTSGELRLLKSMSELSLHASALAGFNSAPTGSWPSIMSIYASEQPDPSSYDHLWPPMFAKIELPLILVDLVNEAPQFVGGWQTSGTDANQRVLHGYLNEQQLVGWNGDATVRWFTNYTSSSSPASAAQQPFEDLIKSMNGRPLVVDLGLGPNGTFELSLEGPDAELFQLDPVLPVSKQTAFNLMVSPQANRTLFDREKSPSYDLQKPYKFNVDLVARDFGTIERKSSRIRCTIELMDANDNAPQFDTDLYSWSVYENAHVGQLLGQVRARDSDLGDGARVRYTALTGRDQQVFRLDPDNGQVTLEGHLDREKKSLYLFLVEARDLGGAGNANYSQVMINVLDVNDNAPVFLQTHYDAVLLADGTFHQPLVVRALDADEPGTANSQVAYEIIAGNQNEQFSIDSVSGVIYPNGGGGVTNSNEQSHNPLQIPSVLLEPIVPYNSQPNNNQNSPELAGKILPNHEVEDIPRNRTDGGSTSGSGSGPKHRIQVQATSGGEEVRPRSLVPLSTTDLMADENPNRTTIFDHGNLAAFDHDQLPNLDLLMNLESQAADEPLTAQTTHKRRALANAATNQVLTAQNQAIRLPPITTLVVRAHDFGIPLRSSTVKVNIYNQALLSRSVSLILNGTSEQLEQRREAIERAFSSIVGSRATIESIDALSESSSISVARVKLAIPQHSLVDLTDLSALMNAIDYHPHHLANEQQQQQQLQQRNPTHYFTTPNGQLIPISGNVSSNLSSNSIGYHQLYNDVNSFALDVNSQLERRLLIYIIIVGVCILALLVIWMIYSCSRETDQVKIIEKSIVNRGTGSGNFHRTSSFFGGRRQTSSIDHQHQKYNQQMSRSGAQKSSNMNMEKTQVKQTMTDSAIGNNLGKLMAPSINNNNNNDCLSTVSQQLNANDSEPLTPATTTLTTFIRPDHLSMYNGQVWFGPGGVALNQLELQQHQQRLAAASQENDRRASSAPSAASLDSALHSTIHNNQQQRHKPEGGRNSATALTQPPRQAKGQFFPNTIGYMENLASMQYPVMISTSPSVAAVDEFGRPLAVVGNQYVHTSGNRRNRRRKVAPMVLNGYQQPQWIAAPNTVAPNKPPRANNNNGKTRMVDGSTEIDELGHTNEAFEHDLESGNLNKHLVDDEELDSLRTSSAAGSESSGESLVLGSDQELLGFDSNGTPIIASHHRNNSTRPSFNSNTIVRQPPLVSSISGSIKQQDTSSGTLHRQQQKSSSSSSAPMTSDQPEVDKENSGKTAGDSRMAATEQQTSSDIPLQEEKIQVTSNNNNSSNKESRRNSGNKSLANEPIDLMGELNEKLAKRQQELSAIDGDSKKLESATTSALEDDMSNSDGMKGVPTTSEGRVRGKLERTGVEKERVSSATEEVQSIGNSSGEEPLLSGMQNGELLEKQSIFAITYSGLATDKLPA